MRETVISVGREIIQTALISLGIFFFVYIFLVQPHRVKGDSMMPNFVDGELLLTEKVSYHLYKPKRGDVIVFKAPGPRKVDFIKRIVGLPGETIKIERGEIFINNQKIEEPYETQATEGTVNAIIGKDEYFVLGDNRGASSDSRTFGVIARNSLKGKAWFIYWPLFKSEKYNGARRILGVNYGIPDTFEDSER